MSPHPHFKGRPVLVGDEIKVINLEDANTSYPYDETVEEITLDFKYTDDVKDRVYYGRMRTGSGFEVYETEELAKRYAHDREMAGYLGDHTPKEGNNRC
jgi:hypothetical protein